MKLGKTGKRLLKKAEPKTATFIHAMLHHIQQVENTAQSLIERTKQLEQQVHELTRQAGQHSQNSSKPPSSDGLRKPASLRPKGGKIGPPVGHEGTTLSPVEQPDAVIEQPLTTCAHCSASLEDVPAVGYARRQVFDLPPPRVIVTEYRAEEKCCPHCRSVQHAAFPPDVTAPAQYGPMLRAWMIYLNQQHLLPLNRVAQLLEDLTGTCPSEGTILKQVQSCADATQPLTLHIREQLAKSEVVHADETSVRVAGKNQWLHVISDSQWTHLFVHPKRGRQAFQEDGWLPLYEGIVVHDCLPAYFADHYHFTHALCGAHLQRECQGIIENDGHRWAADMKALLSEAWEAAKQARESGKPLEASVLTDFSNRYDEILQKAPEEWGPPKPPSATSKSKRQTKPKATNLGERLIRYKPDILRFLHDPRVPFDNNQAERDIRMTKVKQKISGSFRTSEGASYFACIRSMFSTWRKQNYSVLPSLSLFLQGKFHF
jgi:transposase